MAQLMDHVQQVLHARYEGRSYDIPFSTLDIGQLSSDDALKLALSHYLTIPDRALTHYVVERHTNGNITIRPEAVFG